MAELGSGPPARGPFAVGPIRITRDLSLGDVFMFLSLLGGGLLAWSNLEHEVARKADRMALSRIEGRLDMHEQRMGFLGEQITALDGETAVSLSDIRVMLRRIEDKLDKKADRGG